MEEFCEAEVMWPDNDDRPTGASDGHASPKRTRERGERAAPVEIPRARGRGRGGESLADEPEGAAAELIPPHVLASRGGMVGNQVAFSLCLGQGRTLKGRDLVRVRDSVLRMTGFLEG